MIEKCIPTVLVQDLDELITLCSKLLNNGYKRIELLARNDLVYKALELVIPKFKKIEFGVGTIINKKQCKIAIKKGAKFIVSPGFSKDVAKVCKKRKIEYIPGCITPTEIMEAVKYNITKIKYFPVKIHGGIDGIKALQGPFPNVLFIPSGNIEYKDVKEYLELSNVYAVCSSCFSKINIPI